MIRQLIVCAAIVVTGGVLGANVYNSVVDAPNWGAGIPGSLANARAYFSVADPGTFFRVVSPLAQAVALLALIVCWTTPGARWLAVGAVVALVLTDALTFGYFYPRNTIMFTGALEPAAAAAAWQEWSAMNHLRSAVVLGALVAELLVLIRVAQAAKP